MEINIPDEIFSIKKWECTVRSNENVATFIKELILELARWRNSGFSIRWVYTNRCSKISISVFRIRYRGRVS